MGKTIRGKFLAAAKSIAIKLSVFSLLAAGVVSAYTIKQGDTLWDLAVSYYGDGSLWGRIAEANALDPYNLPIGKEIQIPQAKLGGTPLPEDNYDTYLTAPLTASASTVYVQKLPTYVQESVYTLFETDGQTVSEKIYCTGVTTTPSNALTGCVRGISFGSNGVISEAAGTGKSHSRNTRIAITDNINFTGKALNILFGNQATGASDFIVGSTTTDSVKISSSSTGKYIYAWNGSGNPFIRYNTSTNKWQWSEDGTNTYNFTSSTITQLEASSTRGIGVLDSKIYIKEDSTGGLEFNASGELKVKHASNSGINSDVNGLFVERSDDYNWTGDHTFATGTVKFGAGYVSTTPNAYGVPKADGDGKIDVNWIAPPLTGGVSTTLHYHPSVSGYVSTTTLTTGDYFITVNHGSGVTPKKIRISSSANYTDGSNAYGIFAYGFWDDTNNTQATSTQVYNYLEINNNASGSGASIFGVYTSMGQIGTAIQLWEVGTTTFKLKVLQTTYQENLRIIWEAES